MSFIRRRNRVYHLQLKVPPELSDTLGSGDISISLGTKNRRKAGKLAELANVRYQLAFRELKRRGIKSMGVDIKKLVRDYVKDDLDTWELQHALAGRPGILIPSILNWRPLTPISATPGKPYPQGTM